MPGDRLAYSLSVLGGGDEPPFNPMVFAGDPMIGDLGRGPDPWVVEGQSSPIQPNSQNES